MRTAEAKTDKKPSLGERLRMDWIGYLNSRTHRIGGAWFGIIYCLLMALNEVFRYIRTAGHLDAEGRFHAVVGIGQLLLVLLFALVLVVEYQTKP